MSTRNMAQVINNLFLDEEFKKLFLEDPERAVSEAGLSISLEDLRRMFVLDESDVPAWIEPEVHPLPAVACGSVKVDCQCGVSYWAKE